MTKLLVLAAVTLGPLFGGGCGPGWSEPFHQGHFTNAMTESSDKTMSPARWWFISGDIQLPNGICIVKSVQLDVGKSAQAEFNMVDVDFAYNCVGTGSCEVSYNGQWKNETWKLKLNPSTIKVINVSKNGLTLRYQYVGGGASWQTLSTPE